MRFFKDLTLTVLVLLSVALILELGLRVCGAKYEGSLFTVDAERGYALRPNAQGWEVAENQNYVRINNDGMYDVERPLRRPINVIRIAVLGSSEAEAHTVRRDRIFEAVMQREMSDALQKSGYKAEVLNFAVPGYGLAQEYLTLKDHVWKYDPQIVVLATNAVAVKTAVRKLNPDASPDTPYYVLNNGQLRSDQASRNRVPPDPNVTKWRSRFSDLMNQSWLLTMLNAALSNAPGMLRELPKNVLPSNASAEISSTVPVDPVKKLVYDPANPEMQQAWAVTNAFFKAMKAECDRHGAEFWIVTIESSDSVDPSLQRRRALRQKLGLTSLLESDHHIEHLANEDGILEISLAPVMGDYAVDHNVALHGFFNTDFNHGHLNETGHAVAGSIIAGSLLERSSVLRPLAGDLQSGDAQAAAALRHLSR